MAENPLIGRQLANFRLKRLIGQGGMAQVYYGWDVKLQRPVAVKVIDARYRDRPSYAERFVREAQAVASWRHEHIIQVYYADEEDGLYYFAMEYIDGQSLAQMLEKQRGPLPQEEVLRIGQAVAGALDYAHQQGVIHRDIKPANILLAKDGRVVLTDFGLALDMHQGSIGEAFGTPHYISPEQARRSADAVPQSDIYSLGVVFYEMLTGAVPFDDPSPTSVALQHITQAPPPPREVNPDLNAATEAVILEALEKRPEARPRTAGALVEALEAALRLGKATVPTRPKNLRGLALLASAALLLFVLTLAAVLLRGGLPAATASQTPTASHTPTAAASQTPTAAASQTPTPTASQTPASVPTASSNAKPESLLYANDMEADDPLAGWAYASEAWRVVEEGEGRVLEAAGMPQDLAVVMGEARSGWDAQKGLAVRLRFRVPETYVRGRLVVRSSQKSYAVRVVPTNATSITLNLNQLYAPSHFDDLNGGNALVTWVPATDDPNRWHELMVWFQGEDNVVVYLDRNPGISWPDAEIGNIMEIALQGESPSGWQVDDVQVFLPDAVSTAFEAGAWPAAWARTSPGAAQVFIERGRGNHAAGLTEGAVTLAPAAADLALSCRFQVRNGGFQLRLGEADGSGYVLDFATGRLRVALAEGQTTTLADYRFYNYNTWSGFAIETGGGRLRIYQSGKLYHDEVISNKPEVRQVQFILGAEDALWLDDCMLYPDHAAGGN